MDNKFMGNFPICCLHQSSKWIRQDMYKARYVPREIHPEIESMYSVQGQCFYRIHTGSYISIYFI